jgi:hypothetical protein
MIDPHCHSASILVNATPEKAFEIMSDPIKQAQWALGSMNRKEVEPGIVVGTSIFDGKETWVRVRPNKANMTIDYDTGRTREGMRFRNAARVLPGPMLNHVEQTAVITLLTWRFADQSDAAWNQVSVVHEAEMFLIKGLLER